MKKIFTHLLAVFMLSLLSTSAWAETTTVTVTPSSGSYNLSTEWASVWTSTTEPTTTLSVNVNNIYTRSSDGAFEIAPGTAGSSDWYFSVTGYRIQSFTFTYKLESSGTIKITANGEEHSVTAEEQTLTATSTNSFRLSGDNNRVVITNVTLEVEALTKSSTLEVGKVYMFESARASRSLRADGTEDVHTKTTDANDLAQQWYVTKDGDYYVLRNLACGKYLMGALTKQISWSLTDDYSATENKFSLLTSNSTLNTLKTNESDQYGHMHDDNNDDNGGKNVVGWENGDSNTGSHWTIYNIDYSDVEITELLEAAPTTAELKAWYENFPALFNETACYTPKHDSLAEAQATDEYKSLSTELKALVDKIYGKTYNGTWAEDNADATKQSAGYNWDAEYAKKFRVQMYEPYSIAGDITSFLRMNAHSNNDNPTGIYVSEPCIMYVMVEGTVEEGATLRLVRAGSNYRIQNATTDGYALTTGLNVINITEVTEGGDHLYICYNVDTYNPDGATVADKFPHKLSDYKPLKIHIEGGYINGFYNAQGDFRAADSGTEDLWKTITGASYDCDEDWKYMEVRANLAVLPIISNRQVMLFQLEDTNGSSGTKTLLPESVTVPTVPNYYTDDEPTWDDYGMGCDPETGKINIWMETWDRIMHAELATLGLIQKADVDKMNQFYPRWNFDGSRGEIYNYGAAADGVTYQDFCRGLDYSEYYNHHGVSLGTESGFMSAGWFAANYNINTLSSLVTMAGNCTDGVNNYAVDIWGPAHEIGHQFQDVFNIRGGTEVTNNVFSNAAVWYQGGQTSRYNWGGLDSALSSFNSGLPFIDYNIWSMTQMFYKLWLYYHLAGNNTQFYPRFFELLRVDPLNAKGATATGTDSMLKIYEKMCDAAGEDLTEFFRAHGFFVLLDNYPKGDYGTTVFTQTQDEVDAAIARVKEKYNKENYTVLLINDLTTEILCHDGENKRVRFDNTPASEYGTVDNFINGTAEAGGTYTATVNSDGTVTMDGEGGIGFLVFDENGELVSFSYNSTFVLGDEAVEAIMTGNATFVSVGTDVDAEPVAATVDLAAMQKQLLGNLIAKAQPLVDKMDNTYTKIGFYKGAALADLEKALENAKTVYAGASGYEAAYDLLYAELKKVEANPDAKIPFDSSLTYIITNYAYPTRTMTVVNNVVYANTNVDTTTDAAKWQFKETGTPGVYNVYNLSGIYCGTISGSTAVATTTEQASASNYTVDDLGDGLWAISLNPAGINTQFHSAANDSYKVVGWNTGGNATKWYLTAVEANSTIANLTDLEVYINKTETLLNEVLGTVTYTRGSNIELQTTTEGTAGYIWTNAQSEAEGPIENLIDGSTTNHFHTDYTTEPQSGSHYIAVDLGAGNSLERFAFSHTTRSGVSSDFPKSVDVYGSDDNVTYKYLGSASGMPQTAGTFWQYEGVMVASHRYLRFNMHASRGYWHMAEFDIQPVESYVATVNDTYSSSVTVETVTAAMEALLNGKGVAFSMSPTTETIDPVLKVLETAYDNLYTEYTSTVTARKNTLAQLVSDTQTLIDQVGTVEIIATSEVALQTTDPNGDFYVSTNAQSSAEGDIANLVDGVISQESYFHTDYSGANSTDELDHYINISLGSNNATDRFRFSYANRTNAEANFASAMTIYGSTDGTTYEEITKITEGLPASKNSKYNSDVIECTKEYTYLRFMVTANSSNVLKGGHAFFHMAEFYLTIVGSTTVTIKSSYDGVVSEDLLLSSHLTTRSSEAMSINELVTSVPLLDAQIADQQAAKDKLYAAINNTAALKASLKTLIDNTQALYDKMATGEGAVNEYYSTSTLTAENLSEALAEIADAQTVCDNSSATVDEINTAFDELNNKYDVLNGIETLNVTDRTELQGLITTMQGLLEATTENGAVETGDIALQTNDASAPFYIWHFKPATDDDGGIANIIDETDGVANTTSFTGTYWQAGSVDPYTHYLEIDLGVNNVFEDLSIDYTTRNSTHADQRPNGLKFLGSNDKVNYEEFYSVTEGLPTEANTKWSMATPIELAKNYRYVRIAVSTEAGYFNMSDFNLYSHCIATVNEFYSTSDIFECLPAAMRGYCDANDAMAIYLSSDDYDAAKDALQAQIDALQAIVDGDVADRSALETLATETEPVIESVATISTDETELTMQCTDPTAPYYLYCNADGTKTNGSGDALGVAALVGANKDDTSHLHTTYGNQAQDDDLDHYLRLDMGENEAMMSFKFSYTGRSSNSNNDPSTIVIQGTNTVDGVWDEITTLNDLPTDGDGVVYNSEVIESEKAYRYIRFMVTATQNNATNNGHPFFVLSKFSVTACKTIAVKTEYQSPNLPLSTLVTAYNEVADARAVVNSTTYVTSTAYNTALAELQAAKDALEAGKNLKDIPVILTTDVNNPVLYKIKVKSNDNVFTYQGEEASSSKKPVLAADELGNRYQAWYFMQGTNGEGYDDIFIMPYYNEGAQNTTSMLGYASIDDDTTPVASEAGASSYNWYLTFTENSTTTGFWNLQPEGGNTVNAFVNQYGGSSSTKLAFWQSTDNPSDNGSQFQFVLDETDYSLSDAYYALYNQITVYGSLNVTSGTTVGTYTAASVEVYTEAFNNAKDLTDAKNSTDDEYNAAREALVEAFEALVINMPDPAKYYVLRCNHENRYIYVNAENKMQWAASSYDTAQSRAVWQFEDDGDDNAHTFKMKSLHTRSYLNELVDGQWTLDEETGKVVTVAVSPKVSGALIFKIDGHGDEGLHAHGSNNTVVAYTNDAGANHYFIEEVDDISGIKHDVTMKTKFSSVMLNYNVTVPAGVEAYNAEGIEGGYVTLVKIADADEDSEVGNVIPANTPVILYIPEFSAQATMTFNYTESTVDGPVDTYLGGSLYTKYVECDDADYYKLMIKNNEAKMYLMYKEFNAEGVSQGANHNGGHIKCSANKIYMRVPAASGMASFGMRFATPGTTGIDEVTGENAKGKEIYDLTGRKLNEITESGFYIVNGKKVYVK